MRLGGHHALLRAHLGLAAALMSYFEWGTAIAQDVSQDPAGTDLGEPGPTPRWGYQGLVR